MTKQKEFTRSCALILGMLAAGNAAAGTVFYTEFIQLSGPADMSIFDTGILNVPDSTDLAALPQFDGTMGTLTEVSLQISGDLMIDLEILGMGILDLVQPNQAGVDAESGIGAGVPVGGSTQLRAWETQFTPLNCFVGDSGTEGPCNDFGGDNFFFDTEDFFSGSEMTTFMGTGDLSAVSIDLLFGVESPFIDNLDDALVFAELDFIGDVTVTYTFSEVPVPAAAWLFGSAILGLAGVARRKKAA